ncbi:MAG: cupin domain-containing protein [Proteobacteria bacterium]|nr:cupin domain-containing protein [Pseudomonadota bacterium]
MRRAVTACCLAALLLPGQACPDPPAQVMSIVREADLHWQRDPQSPGLESAVLAGDPRRAGEPYVLRVRFAPGAFSHPHFHPNTRYIVVLKGTWWVGAGAAGNRDATTPLPPGSFVIHHAGEVHFDGAKDEEVIVQITGIGPGTATAVDATGRPRP